VPAQGPPWPAALRAPIAPHEYRLVGPAPELTWLEDGSETTLVLTAPGRDRATVRAASFAVPTELVQRWRPADVLYLSRTPAAGLGLALHRAGALVAAAGAITSVPLGPYRLWVAPDFSAESAPGVDECLALSCAGEGWPELARATASMLMRKASLTRWDDRPSR
jgi:hypothetical protein